MDPYRENQFVFANKYRLARHAIFWMADTVVFTYLFRIPEMSVYLQLLVSLMWAALHMVFAYPIMYIFIPRFLLKEKTAQFILIMIAWGIAGWYWNYFCRQYLFFNVYELITGSAILNPNPWAPNSYLSMMVPAGVGSAIILFKYWMRKQHDYLMAEKEKTNAELQLLKAQIHPHFLFNTLNNIYSFSMAGSQKATGMIAKLSSLLSYILYDCKHNEVALEKELEILRNYIDLEKERYGNKLEISMNTEGDIPDKYISPLLFLPFIENAFKHGLSEQLEKPWLSIDISVKQNILYCKIINSKNENNIAGRHGIGIDNLKKRLQYLYPGRHELKLSDDGEVFVVAMMLELAPAIPNTQQPGYSTASLTENYAT
jgi:hypothetical protein